MRRKKEKRKRRKLLKAPLPRCGRLCDLQRQVPSALRVLRASGSVPRPSVGHSSFAAVTGAQNCGDSAVAVLLVARNAWFDSGYMICISSRVAFGRIPVFST